MVLRHIVLTFVGFSIIVFGLALSGSAQAQVKSERLKKFTEDNVTAFIEDTTAITSVHNVDYNDAKVSAYLKKHIDKKARFKTSLRFVMPGVPEQKQTLSLSKDDYIEQVKQGADSIEHYHSEIEIGDITISKNKKTASVNTVSTETGIMQVEGPDGDSQDLPIEGRSECFQVLKIGKKGYIEMYSANCKTVMEFKAN